MVYWFIAISVGAFFLGYVWGLDRGLRNTFVSISASRLKKRKNKTNKAEMTKPRLRLIKKDDNTRV